VNQQHHRNKKGLQKARQDTEIQHQTVV